MTRDRPEQPKRRAPGTPRSVCPVACTLDVIGDRWTLLIVRDLLLGKTRYGEFLASAERIPTNSLADRLRRLERAGIVESVPYSEHPPRVEYRLTPKGRELGPVIRALLVWGTRHIPGTVPPAVTDSSEEPSAPRG